MFPSFSLARTPMRAHNMRCGSIKCENSKNDWSEETFVIYNIYSAGTQIRVLSHTVRVRSFQRKAKHIFQTVNFKYVVIIEFLMVYTPTTTNYYKDRSVE